MSVGISLSQLIVENPQPLSSGIKELDESLGEGFQPRSIYEICGPPGIGKTRLGLQLVEHVSGKALWIETFKPLPTNLFKPSSKQKCYRTRCSKFTQLLYLFQSLLSKQDSYQLVIIDGFSQLACDHMYHLQMRSSDSSQNQNMHEIKCRHLSTIFTAMTKYTHSTRSTVVLLNHCMNTSYQNGTLFEQDFDIVDDGSNFFVTTTNTKRNVQVLKSALVASGVAMGSRDSRWESFIDQRISMYWDWTHDKGSSVSRDSRLQKTRIAFVASASASRRPDTVKIRCECAQQAKSANLDDDVVWDSEG